MAEKATSIDYSLCIVCQKKTHEGLIENPISHEKLLKFIEERVEYGDSQFSDIWIKLQTITPLKLLSNNASWHRKCYQEVVHTGKLERVKQRHERELAGPNESRRKSRVSPATVNTQLTRSQTSPYNKDVCFFCDIGAGYRGTLNSVSTTSAGHSLRAAIELARNEKLLVKLSTAIDASDAHAIDIKYHLRCYANNVTNVLRKTSNSSSSNVDSAEIAARIEFLDTTETSLRKGRLLNMAELEATYTIILQENNVANASRCRKTLKQLISSEIPGVEFHRPNRMNQPEMVSLKETRDAAMRSSEEYYPESSEPQIKTLYDAAVLLRHCINKSKKWDFTGSLDNITDEQLPKELYSFFRWVIQGPKATLNAEEKSLEVHKRAVSLSQSTISMTLSERQAQNKKSEILKVTKEMPQQLAVGLAVHQAFRCKEIVNMLHGFGMSVEYNRLLRVEAQIEKSVLQRIEQNGGVYLPPDIVIGRHVFFAIDNVDFAEDTYDGKRTLHGAAMAIYQKRDPGDVEPDLRLF